MSSGLVFELILLSFFLAFSDDFFRVELLVPSPGSCVLLWDNFSITVSSEILVCFLAANTALFVLALPPSPFSLFPSKRLGPAFSDSGVLVSHCLVWLAPLRSSDLPQSLPFSTWRTLGYHGMFPFLLILSLRSSSAASAFECLDFLHSHCPGISRFPFSSACFWAFSVSHCYILFVFISCVLFFRLCCSRLLWIFLCQLCFCFCYVSVSIKFPSGFFCRGQFQHKFPFQWISWCLAAPSVCVFSEDSSIRACASVVFLVLSEAFLSRLDQSFYEFEVC